MISPSLRWPLVAAGFGNDFLYSDEVVRPPSSTNASGSTDPEGLLALAPHPILGGRYRLQRLLRAPDTDVTDTDGGSLWRAQDTVLARPVALRLLLDAPARTRQAFLTAAAQAGRTTDPLVAPTYDAAEESADDGEAPQAYLVREWVDGLTLRDLLLDGPLPPERAAAVIRDAARAVDHVHRMGSGHGAVHPANLFVRDDGQVRLCDAGVRAALRTAAGAEPIEFDAQVRADTEALGATLYACLTGRWPFGSWRGLPPAPTAPSGPPRALPPRHVRAGVPRGLDAVVMRILQPDRHADLPPLRTPAAVAAALATWPRPDTVDPRVSPAPPGAPRRRRLTPWRLRALLATIVVVLAAVGWSVGQSLGRLPGQNNGVPAFSTAPASPGAARPSATVPILGARSFDPPPGDGSENPDQVFAAYDGEQSTAWETQQYQTAALGNLKPGVGLLVDLGSPQAIREVDLTFRTPGTAVEIRAAAANAQPGTALTDFPLVAGQPAAGTSVALQAQATARYWLVWLTSLPKVGGSYRGAIAEMAFRR